MSMISIGLPSPTSSLFLQRRLAVFNMFSATLILTNTSFPSDSEALFFGIKPPPMLKSWDMLQNISLVSLLSITKALQGLAQGKGSHCQGSDVVYLPRVCVLQGYWHGGTYL